MTEAQVAEVKDHLKITLHTMISRYGISNVLLLIAELVEEKMPNQQDMATGIKLISELFLNRIEQ